MGSIRNYCFAACFIWYLFFSALSGAIFIMGPSFVLLLFNERLFRWYNDFAVRLWLVLPGAFLELIFGTKLVLVGDSIDVNDCPLIIMNHRCRLDWMFYWMALLRYGRLANEKIIMKHELKLLPGPGWAMQNLMFLFLQRRWEQDESYLNGILDYFIDLKYPLQLFLYPEGTDLCEESLIRSHSYAEKMKVVKYDYVLHPRVKGFNYLVQKLRGNLLDTIHDVTVGYPVNLCYGEKDLLVGNFPKEIHIHIKSYKMSDIPTESEEVDQWCIQRWAEKEECLKQFYIDGKFTDQRPVVSNNAEQRAQAIMWFILFFWSMVLFISAYSMYYFSIARWYCFIMVVFYIVQTMRGGTDKLQLDIHEWNKTKSE